MKKLNVKAALVLSLLAFSACDKGGGGSSTPQVVGVPGVTQRQYTVVNGQTCTINGDNTYTCTENGQTLGNIGFTSLETFCNILMNDQANGYVARYTRQQMYQEQCSGAQNNGFCGNGSVMQNGVCVNNNGNNFPGTINPGGTVTTNSPDMKSVSCQLVVKKGSTVGDTGIMNVPVIQNSASGVNIFAFTNASIQKTFLKFFHFQANKFSNSEKLAKVKMYYTRESGKADMIKLEAIGIDDKLGATVTGYAGSEVKLEIAPQNEYSDATSVSISCAAPGAAIGNTSSYKSYRCNVTEKIGNKESKYEYASPYNDSLMGDSFDLTKAVKLHTDGNLATDAGTATIEQLARYSIDASVSTKSNITTPTVVTVARPDYRLKVDCRPSN
ncbi:hypothetical protein CIK05_01605 [Bdellovibrio sp. qaytius]|nr:hypothetical protein CIK05_01605 [Bdellovibrio sp. qaytius]